MGASYAIIAPEDCMSSDREHSANAGPVVDDQTARRIQEVRAICAANPLASFENVWHTLTLLDLPPIERLNRSLLRGRPIPVHR